MALSEGIRKKVDPGLRRLLDMSDEQIVAEVEKEHIRVEELRRRREASPATGDGGAAIRPRYAAAHWLAAVEMSKLRPLPMIRAIVEFTGNRDDLVAMGLQISTQAQDIFTIKGSRAQLLNLAAQDATRRVRLPRVLEPVVEDASAQSETADVHFPRPPVNPGGFEGNGVIVGLHDSPLDVTHHTFRDPNLPHHTRLLYYWVQQPHTLNAQHDWVLQPTAPGQTPEDYSSTHPGSPDFTGLNYGILYDEAAINAALDNAAGTYGVGANQICCEPEYYTDIYGLHSEHGTHTTGIAAGNGRESNWSTAPHHIGAAPLARIVHVSYEGDATTLEDRNLNALDFVFRVAAHESMPAVASVSLDTNFGPHNGDTLFDATRDNLLNSFDNRAIVWAAGNENNRNAFQTSVIHSGATADVVLTPNAYLYWLEIWYTGPELEFSIDYAGHSSGTIAPPADYHGSLGGCTVDAERGDEAGMHAIHVSVPSTPVGSPWTVHLTNPGTDDAQYYAWVAVQGNLATLGSPTKDQLTLDDTSCGRSILTVGACNKIQPNANPALGETITIYSSAGPTVDGRIKPEIVAVGDSTTSTRVISAASDQSSGYTAMGGTSMAAPLVAGTVALLFEEYHGNGVDLNHDSVKALLLQHTNKVGLHLEPTQPGFVQKEQNLYGYGRLRAIEPIDQIQPPVHVDVWVRTAEDDYGLQPYPGGCFCCAPDIQVYDSNGVETTQITWGNTYHVRVTARNLGSSQAAGTKVKLLYTLPWAAPKDWHDAENVANQPLESTVSIPPFGETPVDFDWRPEASEISAPAATTHFCLLAELDNPYDPLQFAAAATSGGDAWQNNIKGTNNVALKNLHIQ